MKQELQGYSTSLSEETLAEIVGKDHYQAVKAQNPGAVIKAFVLAHVGTSKPKILGKGQAVIHWSLKAIQSVSEKVQAAMTKGLALFDGHGETNSHEGRRPIGEVIGETVIDVAGKMASVIVALITDKAVADRSDCCSVEADAEIEEIDRGQYIAHSVNEVSAVALANRQRHAPGFPGANELFAVQAFNELEDEPKKGAVPMSEEMTFEQLRAECKRHKAQISQIVSPSEAFGERVLMPDGTIFFKGGDKQFNSFLVDYEQQIRGETAKERQLAADLQKENETLKSQLSRYEARPKVLDKLKSADVPERVRKLAETNIESFVPGDDLDKSIQDYLTQQAAQVERLIAAGVLPAEEIAPQPPRTSPKPVPNPPAGTKVDESKSFLTDDALELLKNNA